MAWIKQAGFEIDVEDRDLIKLQKNVVKDVLDRRELDKHHLTAELSRNNRRMNDLFYQRYDSHLKY